MSRFSAHVQSRNSALTFTPAMALKAFEDHYDSLDLLCEFKGRLSFVAHQSEDEGRIKLLLWLEDDYLNRNTSRLIPSCLCGLSGAHCVLENKTKILRKNIFLFFLSFFAVLKRLKFEKKKVY